MNVARRPWLWFTCAAFVAVLLVALWWPLAERREPDTAPAAEGASAAGGVSGVESAVADYVEFAAGLNEGGRLDDATLAEGLRKLAGALGTVGAGGAELPIDLRIAAEHVLLNPTSAETAATVRERLVAAGAAIDAGAGELRKIAESIQPEEPLTEQPAVGEFLRRAGGALERRAPE